MISDTQFEEEMLKEGWMVHPGKRLCEIQGLGEDFYPQSLVVVGYYWENGQLAIITPSVKFLMSTIRFQRVCDYKIVVFETYMSREQRKGADGGGWHYVPRQRVCCQFVNEKIANCR